MSKLYPSSMREAKELGYEFCYGTSIMSGEFVSENQMEYEGVMEFDLGLEGDHSDGNLGPVKVRARATFTFERIEPAD